MPRTPFILVALAFLAAFAGGMLMFDSVQRHLRAPPAALIEKSAAASVDANIRDTMAALAQR